MTNARFRHDLPQLDGNIFLSDGGLETELVFHDGLDLPAFAAFPLMTSDAGRARLRRYYEGYLELAARHSTGFVLETPTWRANPDWAAELGVSLADLGRILDDSVALLEDLRAEWAHVDPTVISGCIGPRGDGYVAGTATAQEASAYHSFQIERLADTAADLVTAMTIGDVGEAVGIATAAGRVGMPVVISFTVEIDGRLPSGMPLSEAIDRTDDSTGGLPAYYMVNCAHPTHVDGAFGTGGAGDDDGRWRERIHGMRANASKLSHAELDESTELDDGDPHELGAGLVEMRHHLQNLSVLGGCCGTDARHVAAIAGAWAEAAGRSMGDASSAI